MLPIAAHRGHGNVMQMFLEIGVHVNVSLNRLHKWVQDSALNAAAANRHLDVVRLHVGRGGIVNPVRYTGPLCFAMVTSIHLVEVDHRYLLSWIAQTAARFP